MKHIRLVLGIIGIITASLAAVAQQQPAPPQAPPAAAPQAPPPGAAPQAAIDSPLLRSYSTVSKARLLKPEDRNWLMIRRTYDGWGYSPLDKITPANVSRLKMVWSGKMVNPQRRGTVLIKMSLIKMPLIELPIGVPI